MNISVWLVTILLLFASTAFPVPQAAVPQPRKDLAVTQDPAVETSDYFLGSVSEDEIRLYNSSALSSGANLTTISVSPSGQYIAAVDRSKQSKDDRNAAGIGNPMGRLPEAILLFSRQGDIYKLYQTYYIDRETNLELSSLLGGGADMAWNADETRCIISCKWGASSETNAYINSYHSNLYLLDLADGSFRRLTDNSEPCDHCALPAWSGDGTVRFLRLSNKNNFLNSLCEIDLTTGRETKLADLYSANGAVSVVYDWQMVGQQIYYIVEAFTGGSGFYVSPVGGWEVSARCLVNLMTELRDTNRHPYCRSFGQMEISADGRWACLTVVDQRVPTLDFPFADSPTQPQTDPANAISVRTKRPWVPCHNVFLYDLTQNRLVNPFTDSALAPAKAVVTAACFAPDGQSLLCTVFGDGQPWTIAEQTRTTFYQVDLRDVWFNATRVFETELASSLWFPDGIWWMTGNTLCIPTGKTPTNPVQLLSLGER